MRGAVHPSQDLGRLEPSEQAQWKTKKPSPGESGTPWDCRVPLGLLQPPGGGKGPCRGLVCSAPHCSGALDVGTGVGGLPRGCSDAAERLRKPPQPGGLRTLLPWRLKRDGDDRDQGPESHWDASPGSWLGCIKVLQEVVPVLLSEQKRMGFDELGQRNPLS